MLRPEYPVRTDRLILRPFEERDLDDVFAYWSLPEVCTYLYSEPSDRAGAAERLAKQVDQHQLTAEGQELVLGHLFHPDFHGKGLATDL